jgi:general secretion pathway protein D
MKTRRGSSRTIGFVAVVVVAALLAGCATTGAGSAFRRGEEAAEREMWDHAVLSYAKAVSLEPGNSRYKVALARAKLRAAAAHFDRGRRYLESGQLDLAIDELQETVVLDPSNQYALVELQKALEERERRQRAPSAMDQAKAEAARQAAELGPPKLDPASNVPLVLRFPDSTVGEVYESLAKAAGINILYDEKVDTKKKITDLELANVTFEKALDILMLQNKHAFKVIDAHTILIYEDQRAKRQEYEDHVIRTFYLSNAETKEVQTLLRTLLETRRVAENAELNAITLKDTPEKIKVAERIIKANDKARGEVVIDIELLEINRGMNQDLGIDLSSKALSLAFGGGEEALPLNNLSLLKQQSGWAVGPIPSVLINFIRNDSDTKALSKPQVRILEGEKGSIHIGDRVPIPATSFNTSQTIGGNIVPVTSFTYQNVGIQLEVEPRVHHNKEITLKIKVEISSLAGEVQGTGGQSQPIIGTRTVETTIRLRDGETNLLAGLIKEDERTSLSSVPGLAEIPILRRLFGMTSEEASQTDIVVSLTPHIIRVPDIRPIDLVPLWVGTEENIQLRGVARNALGESPFAGPNPWEEIEAELNGDEEPRGTVRMGRDEAAAAAPDEAEPQRRPRPPVREGAEPEGEPLPDEGTFGPEAEPEDLEPPDAADLEPSVLDEMEEELPERPSGVAQVQLAPSTTRVPAGDTLAVDLLVSDAELVSTVNFQLRYDPAVVRFIPPADVGDFLQQGGLPVDVQAVEAAEGGLLVVSLSRPGSVPASGAGRLLRLNFVALEPGSADFGFSAAQVRGPESQAWPASFRVANVEVVP